MAYENDAISGFSLDTSDAVDDRYVYETVNDVFAPPADPAHTGGIVKARRYDGLPVWIRSEGRQYRFKGGIEKENFVPDSQVITWIVD